MGKHTIATGALLAMLAGLFIWQTDFFSKSNSTSSEQASTILATSPTDTNTSPSNKQPQANSNEININAKANPGITELEKIFFQGDCHQLASYLKTPSKKQELNKIIGEGSPYQGLPTWMISFFIPDKDILTYLLDSHAESLDYGSITSGQYKGLDCLEVAMREGDRTGCHLLIQTYLEQKKDALKILTDHAKIAAARKYMAQASESIYSCEYLLDEAKRLLESKLIRQITETLGQGSRAAIQAIMKQHKLNIHTPLEDQSGSTTNVLEMIVGHKIVVLPAFIQNIPEDYNYIIQQGKYKGQSLLATCCQEPLLRSFIKTLLRMPHINVNHVDEHGNAVIEILAKQEKLDSISVKNLLQHPKISPETKSYGGLNHLAQIATNNNKAFFQQMADKVLMQLRSNATKGDVKEVKKIMATYSINLKDTLKCPTGSRQAKDNKHYDISASCLLASTGNKEILTYYLTDQGVELNIASKMCLYGLNQPAVPPLLFFVKENKLEGVRFICNRYREANNTPLGRYNLRVINAVHEGETALSQAAIQDGGEKIFEELFCHPCIDFTVKEQTISALCNKVSKSSPLLPMLKRKKDKIQEAILQLCLKKEETNTRRAEFLLSQCPGLKDELQTSEIRGEGWTGHTLLHVACRTRDIGLVKWLCSLGDNVHAKASCRNNLEETPAAMLCKDRMFSDVSSTHALDLLIQANNEDFWENEEKLLDHAIQSKNRAVMGYLLNSKYTLSDMSNSKTYGALLQTIVKNDDLLALRVLLKSNKMKSINDKLFAEAFIYALKQGSNRMLLALSQNAQSWSSARTRCVINSYDNSNEKSLAQTLRDLGVEPLWIAKHNEYLAQKEAKKRQQQVNAVVAQDGQAVLAYAQQDIKAIVNYYENAVISVKAWPEKVVTFIRHQVVDGYSSDSGN